MTALGALLVFLALGAQQPPGASISGRVTDRASGRPIPRMIVTAFSNGNRATVEAPTDADGLYEISGLTAGSYAIGVRHDEHRSTYLQQWFGAVNPSSFAGPPPRFNVELKAGERRTGADVALTRGLAIEGRVTDPWDEPLASEVLVTSATGQSFAHGGAHTDDQGMYRVFGLAPGRYRVCVRPGGSFDVPPSGDAPAMVRTCYPAAHTEAEASDVTLTSDDVTGIDIRVQRVGSRSIAGVVVDAAGVPVEGGYVTAYPSDDETANTGSARTRAGAFVVKGLVPGRYTVRASVGGSRLGDVDPPSREAEQGDAVVDVDAIDAANVTIALTKAVSVHGVVRFEGGSAPPTAAARMVVATRRDDGLALLFSSRPSTAPVKDDFSFRLTELFRPPVTLVIQDLPDGWALASVRYEGRDITYVPTDFTATPPSRLELVVTSDVARPSVRLTNDRGEETRAAMPIVLPADPARRRLMFLPIAHESRDGSIALGALLPGEYLVAALSLEDHRSLFRQPSKLDAVARVATKVTFAKGDRRVLTLSVVALPDK